MIRRPRPLRLHWDAVEGWRLDAQTAMSPQEVARMVAWALPKQIDRWKTLPAGPRRDELAAAIVKLRSGDVRVMIVDQAETKMFEAPVPHEDRKIMMVGNGD